MEENNDRDRGFYDHIGFNLFGQQIPVQIPVTVVHETPEKEAPNVWKEEEEKVKSPPEKIESNPVIEAVGREAYVRCLRIFRRYGEDEDDVKEFMTNGWQGWEHAKMRSEIAKEFRRLKLRNQPKGKWVRQLEFPDEEQEKARLSQLQQRSELLRNKIKKIVMKEKICRMKKDRQETQKEKARKLREKRTARLELRMALYLNKMAQKRK